MGDIQVASKSVGIGHVGMAIFLEEVSDCHLERVVGHWGQHKGLG